MQVTKKILLIIFALLFVLAITPQKTYATNTTNIKDGADRFMNNAENRALFSASNERQGIDQLYFIMLTIGIVLAFAVGSILGIQFITSGAAGQAKVKEKIIPFLVGTFVMFGAFGIWRLIYNIMNGFFN